MKLPKIITFLVVCFSLMMVYGAELNYTQQAYYGTISVGFEISNDDEPDVVVEFKRATGTIVYVLNNNGRCLVRGRVPRNLESTAVIGTSFRGWETPDVDYVVDRIEEICRSRKVPQLTQENLIPVIVSKLWGVASDLEISPFRTYFISEIAEAINTFESESISNFYYYGDGSETNFSKSENNYSNHYANAEITTNSGSQSASGSTDLASAIDPVGAPPFLAVIVLKNQAGEYLMAENIEVGGQSPTMHDEYPPLVFYVMSAFGGEYSVDVEVNGYVDIEEEDKILEVDESVALDGGFLVLKEIDVY